MNSLAVRILDRVFRSFGLSVAPRQSLLLTYQHEYGTEGYEKYRRLQIHHNKRKIDQVWADAATLGMIAAYVKAHVPAVSCGMCHGTRRGLRAG